MSGAEGGGGGGKEEGDDIHKGRKAVSDFGAAVKGLLERRALENGIGHRRRRRRRKICGTYGTKKKEARAKNQEVTGPNVHQIFAQFAINFAFLKKLS